ncbi:hypothetical protein QQF64_034695 [Cirrhinus molitorella]|uniref:Uncharacterized protein n=1 Tax=Cirrhinus molitorella TaxID=172907 RepID=A0ABR3L3H5_9TELE
MEMKESTDQSVRDANVQIRTGHKWKAHNEVNQAISRLQQKEIIGRVQAIRAGLGHGEASKFWSKASRKGRKELVVEHMRLSTKRSRLKPRDTRGTGQCGTVWLLETSAWQTSGRSRRQDLVLYAVLFATPQVQVSSTSCQAVRQHFPKAVTDGDMTRSLERWQRSWNDRGRK